MAEHSKIEWTDATWNPITGCSVVSPGCTNCYAMRLAGTRLRNHPSREGLTIKRNAGPVWNGKVRINEQWLDQPLRWRRPRMIFVCAHGDLFHEGVRDEWIDRVFAVMALAPQHIFQVLTKRPERMREYADMAHRCGTHWLSNHPRASATFAQFPLPNVWLGVSVEDQERANERIPLLLDTPTAVRFVSAEPLLGPVNLCDIAMAGSTHRTLDSLTGLDSKGVNQYENDRIAYGLDWVIVGGESGPGARDMDPDWARSLRDQCKAAGVAFFMKQMAHKAPIPNDLMVREFPA